MYLGWKVLEQVGHARLQVGVVDEVVVVEDQVQLSVVAALSSLMRVARTLSRDGWPVCSSANALSADLWRRPLYGGDEVGPEPRGLAV